MCVNACAHVPVCLMDVFARKVWYQNQRNKQHMRQHVDVNLGENLNLLTANTVGRLSEVICLKNVFIFQSITGTQLEA